MNDVGLHDMHSLLQTKSLLKKETYPYACGLANILIFHKFRELSMHVFRIVDGRDDEIYRLPCQIP